MAISKTCITTVLLLLAVTSTHAVDHHTGVLINFTRHVHVLMITTSCITLYLFITHRTHFAVLVVALW